MNIIKVLEKLGEKYLTANESTNKVTLDEFDSYKSSLPDIVCMIVPAEDDDDETEDTPQEDPKETPTKEEKKA